MPQEVSRRKRRVSPQNGCHPKSEASEQASVQNALLDSFKAVPGPWGGAFLALESSIHIGRGLRRGEIHVGRNEVETPPPFAAKA